MTATQKQALRKLSAERAHIAIRVDVFGKQNLNAMGMACRSYIPEHMEHWKCQLAMPAHVTTVQAHGESRTFARMILLDSRRFHMRDIGLPAS